MLPIATSTDIGGIKVGDGLQVSDDGTLSAVGGGSTGCPLDMVITYGAREVMPADETWKPSNIATVYGPKNMQFIMIVDDGAIIREHTSETDTSKQIFSTNEDGISQSHIEMPSTSVNWTASVMVAPYLQPVAQAEGVMAQLAVLAPIERTAAFFPPAATNPENYNVFQSYAYTRGVPCDKQTPSEIDVCIETGMDVSTLNFKVTQGEAVFDVQTNSKTTSASVGADGEVVVKVFCGSPGVSEVMISGNNTDEKIYVYPSFVALPTLTV
jgi:hypothetical protein